MLVIDRSHEDEIDRLLHSANGRRNARTLGRLEVVKCALEALEHGVAVKTGGTVEDARAQTTLVLAVRTDRGVTLGIGAARCPTPDPGQLWPQLDRWLPDGTPHCIARAQSWARRLKDKCIEFEVAAAPAQPPSASAALLAAVLSDPQALEPRAVYADFAQERGDPRGELISVQLTLERLESDDERRPGLEEREALARSRLEQSWRQRLQDRVIHLEYRRGFVERATLHASALDDGGQALLTEEPVRELRLIDVDPDDVMRLLLAPWIARLTSLELHHLNPRDRRRSLNSEDVARLMDTDRLRSLQRLDFTGHALDDTGALMLAHHAASALPRLEELTIARDGLTSVGVSGLVEQPWFSRLTAIDLSRNHLGMGGAALVANAVSPRKLRTLELGANLVGDEGARVLAGSSRLSELHALSLHTNHIGPAGARALLDSPFLRAVTHFNLTGNRIGSIAAKRLMEKARAV